MDELLLMPCLAEDLKKGMVVYLSWNILTVEYARSASYDFTYVKFKEVDEETIQKRYEKFDILVTESEIDNQRDIYGCVPLWCFNASGNMRFKSIQKIKK